MRRAFFIASLLATSAEGHVYVFDFVFGRPVGNTPNDAGVVPLQWVDQESPSGSAVARLRASRLALSPFDRPDANDVVTISGADLPLASVVDVYDWDTADTGEGCWHPYALLKDPVEGEQLRAAEAVVTVARGANMPPAVWVSTPPTAEPDDAGRLQLGWELDEPDDPSVVSIEWATGEARGTLISGLPLAVGTRSAAYTVDVRRLASGTVFLHVVVRSGDAGFCDAWWGGFVTRAGEDAGVVDAGSADAGVEPPPDARCGCGAGGLVPWLLAVLFRRRWSSLRSRA